MKKRKENSEEWKGKVKKKKIEKEEEKVKGGGKESEPKGWSVKWCCQWNGEKQEDWEGGDVVVHGQRGKEKEK